MLIDIPIGPTAKVRSKATADMLKGYLEAVGTRLGIKVKVIFSDGIEPVGCGVGPALEARDVLMVLRGEKNAPQDLRDRALTLASNIIEFSPDVTEGEGLKIATEILDSGKAWKKFQAICEAQGGMRKIPQARYTHPYKSEKTGVVAVIDNRRISWLAKLAGAPNSKAAGVDLHVKLGWKVKKGDVLFTIHAESPGELEYVLGYLHDGNGIIGIKD